MNIGANSFPKEFNMAGSPVVLVLTDVLSGFPMGSTFRQVEITVSCSRPDTSAQRDFVFSLDVSSDEVTVDIASAARSMLMDVNYRPAMLDWAQIEYPYVVLSVKYRAKYMLGGEVLYGVATEACQGTRVVAGRISEMDRLRVRSHVADYFTRLRFTTKPMDGMEIVPLNERVVTTKADAEGNVVGTALTMSSAGVNTLSDGRRVYVMEQDGTMFNLRFVNSMGVMDTATAICRESLSYGIQSESYSLATKPSNLDVPSMEALKSGGRAVFSMSSGFVSRKWADWWAEEVMRAQKCWLKFGKQRNLHGDVETVTDLWLPCILTPKDEEVQVYDRTGQNLYYVAFKLEVSAEGSLLRGLL